MRNGIAKHRDRVAFGDFQTPRSIADRICILLQRRGVNPQSVVEPTCGVGGMLFAAGDAFPIAKQLVGVEINAQHLTVAESVMAARTDSDRFQLVQADFYHTDWQSLLDQLPQPLLLIGNPPWVTNAAQGVLTTVNLPTKSNFQRQRGIDAITGKSNFDISEWMLLQMFDWLRGRRAFLAMLCKSAVARRVLGSAWRSGTAFRSAEMHSIDAAQVFGASVDACLFLVEFAAEATCDTARVFPVSDLSRPISPSASIGWCDGRLIADLDRYRRTCHLCAEVDGIRQAHTAAGPVWRSGVKHDCAAVMELLEKGGRLWNKLGEAVDVESDYVYPLLKSGDVAAGRTQDTQKWLLLPQRSVGEDTRQLETAAPRVWHYLLEHSERLDRRRSSIYRRQPRFAVFGVGEYSFTTWKVAVSGLAKRFRFEVVGPIQNRPVVFDDATYFLPCRSEAEAESTAKLLNSAAAQDFFSAFIFWDAKRPITAEILRRLDLNRLASTL